MTDTGIYRVTTDKGRELAFFDGNRYATATRTYAPRDAVDPQLVDAGWASLYHLQHHRRGLLDSAAGEHIVIIRNRKPVAILAPLDTIKETYQ